MFINLIYTCNQYISYVQKFIAKKCFIILAFKKCFKLLHTPRILPSGYQPNH